MRAQPADRSWVSSRDLRFAVRSLTGGPGFSLGVIGSLVLGIVANITAFSFVNAAVFRPFPGVHNQHELVAVGVARAERLGSVISSSYEEYQTLRASLPALDDLAAQLRVQLVVTHRGESSAVNAALVSAGWFDVLGVRPAAGRFFLAHVPARLLHIRVDQSGQFTLPALQKAVRDVDYRVPIRDATTLRERRDRTDQERRLLAMASWRSASSR